MIRPFTQYPVNLVIDTIKRHARTLPPGDAKKVRSEWAERIRKHRKPGTNAWNIIP